MYSFCICDDDTDCGYRIKELLEQYASAHGYIFHIHVYTDSNALSNELEHGIYCNFYLLDIIMPLTSGLDIAKSIRAKDKKAHILFLTSSPEYALDSYAFHADNYLIKPITSIKLFPVLDTIFTEMMPAKAEQLVLNLRSGSYSLFYDTIIYVEAKRNIVIIALNNSDAFEYNTTFSTMEQTLINRKEFVKIHRSYIINMNYIISVTNKELTLFNHERVPVSATYSREFQSRYLAYLESLSHF